MSFDVGMEEALYDLVTNHLPKDQLLKLKKYQTSIVYVYDPAIIRRLLDACKFKDVGNIYDYPKVFPKMRMINGYDLTANFESFQRIGVSKKLNSAVIYNFQEYSYYCVFMLDIKKLKKFAKITKPILQEDVSQINVFQDIDFKCKPGTYIEVAKTVANPTKPVSAVKKKVSEEKLVFEESSVLTEVMDGLTTFFTKETEDFYKKMDIPYKRGIIMHGPPGTGKSTLIREMIRRIGSEVSKIIINPNVSYEVTYILSSLLKALNGKPAVIIIEDMDSLISDENRSEFLNILDGVDVKSGAYIIGTTNYPERIDPAFTNRAGRFDRSYKIDNPTEKTRKLFFESRNLGEVFDTKEDIAEIFAKNTEGFPMASLKEVITTTKYTLAGNPKLSIAEAVAAATDKLNSDKAKHMDSHKKFKKKKKFEAMFGNMGNDDDDDDDAVEVTVETPSEVVEVKVAGNEKATGYIRIIKKDDAEIVFEMFK
jgi:DNA polymerase III delta prime subunit